MAVWRFGLKDEIRLQPEGTRVDRYAPHRGRQLAQPGRFAPQNRPLGGAICKNERLCLYSKTALDNELKRVAKKAGLPEIHVHELRHSHASFLIHNGVDILTVSNRLGHERTSTTMNIYGHMYKEENKKVVQLLSDAMENTESNQ